MIFLLSTSEIISLRLLKSNPSVLNPKTNYAPLKLQCSSQRDGYECNIPFFTYQNGSLDFSSTCHNHVHPDLTHIDRYCEGNPREISCFLLIL